MSSDRGRRIGKVLRHQSDKLGSWIESSRTGRGLCFSGADAATLLLIFVVEIGLHVTAMFYHHPSFHLHLLDVINLIPTGGACREVRRLGGSSYHFLWCSGACIRGGAEV